MNVVADIRGTDTTTFTRGNGLVFSKNNGVRTTYNNYSNGGTAQLVKPDGTFTEYTYTAYGEIKYNSTDNTNPFTYCGEYTDTETGLVYLRNRYYDPELGIFLTQDPAMDGFNWYAYCAGDPVNFIDPTGYITKEEQEMYESGEMAPGAYSYLMYCTYGYYLNIDDEYTSSIYNRLAEAFRKSNYTITPFEKWNNIINGMASKPSNNQISEWEHYYRNNLNLEYSFEEIIILNQNLPEEMRWDDGVNASEHQNHLYNNQPNIKFVSGCGHFEIIYNANHEIQNQYNNTDDMGTYNYSPSNKISGYLGHFIYDMMPYYDYINNEEAWGNVPENERVVPNY